MSKKEANGGKSARLPHGLCQPFSPLMGTFTAKPVPNKVNSLKCLVFCEMATIIARLCAHGCTLAAY